ncbi:integrase [Vibrio sp. 10N.286.49.B3]|uniref:integrase n=1 Tax=Vibrio sp. 10N.286.49.B3 TaxID=1880855 RepID=UPI000CB057F1|nr:integrase [Vibrio sp. 10N.286.49.B3]PMH39906.1 integrase [Vibrio sp. 10N.286.49.B3]
MDDNVFQFKPQAELTSAVNLASFINKVRGLMVFDADKWAENKWETYYGTRRVVARFSTATKPSTSYSYEPLSKPYLDFAKAYIKYTYSLKPVTNLQRQFEALRVLEEALLDVHGTADILSLNGVVLAKLDDVFKQQLSNPSALNKAGYQMELLLDFCRDNLIAPSLPEWTNPYSKIKDLTVSLDEKGKEYRSDKLPTDEEMLLIAHMFSNAPTLGVETEYYTAIMALLMTAPSRGSELTTLRVRPEVWEQNRAGDWKLGLQWVPAKKGKAGVKWTPTVMQETVQESLKRLVKIGAPAREAAKFAEVNPNKFMRHSGCITPEGFKETTPLTIEQFNAAMGLNLKNFNPTAPTPKWLIEILKENNGSVTYEALGRYEYAKLIKKFKKWPYADKAKHVKVSDCLLLHRENEFHEKFNPRAFSFLLPTVNQINDRFVQKDSRDGRSLWSKNGVTKSDGSQIQVQSHNARHWLSTKAEQGGMEALVLANWAGRAKVEDNKRYDNRTEDEKSDEMADTLGILDVEDVTILDKIEMNLPVLFQDIGKDLPGSAIVTELGVCEHDYSMMPCGNNGDCEVCKELVCIKGMEGSLENLKKREIEVASQLAKSITDRDMGVFGSERWIAPHGWRLAHIRTKIRILEDEKTPDGTPVRIPEEYDPSPVKEVLRKKGFDDEIVSPDTIGITTEDLVQAVEGSSSEDEGFSDDVFDLMEDL